MSSVCLQLGEHYYCHEFGFEGVKGILGYVGNHVKNKCDNIINLICVVNTQKTITTVETTRENAVEKEGEVVPTTTIEVEAEARTKRIRNNLMWISNTFRLKNNLTLKITSNSPYPSSIDRCRVRLSPSSGTSLMNLLALLIMYLRPSNRD